MYHRMSDAELLEARAELERELTYNEGDSEALDLIYDDLRSCEDHILSRGL